MADTYLQLPRAVDTGTSTGTANAIPKFTDADTIGDSSIVDAGVQAVAALTDNTAGTANSTLEAITGTLYTTDVAAIRNNFADLAAKVNAIRTALVNYGLIGA